MNKILVITSKEQAKNFFSEKYRELYDIIWSLENAVKGMPKEWLDYCEDPIKQIGKIFNNNEEEN